MGSIEEQRVVGLDISRVPKNWELEPKYLGGVHQVFILNSLDTLKSFFNVEVKVS